MRVGRKIREIGEIRRNRETDRSERLETMNVDKRVVSKQGGKRDESATRHTLGLNEDKKWYDKRSTWRLTLT